MLRSYGLSIVVYQMEQGRLSCHCHPEHRHLPPQRRRQASSGDRAGHKHCCWHQPPGQHHCRSRNFWQSAWANHSRGGFHAARTFCSHAARQLCEANPPPVPPGRSKLRVMSIVFLHPGLLAAILICCKAEHLLMRPRRVAVQGVAGDVPALGGGPQAARGLQLAAGPGRVPRRVAQGPW